MLEATLGETFPTREEPFPVLEESSCRISLTRHEKARTFKQERDYYTSLADEIADDRPTVP